ncbi:restriction endonuclease (plasmid) [Guyparkeria sp. 1SP6A2]|nr:restriction endonuclease [Guyparkeria sp. 1SP6A2]
MVRRTVIAVLRLFGWRKPKHRRCEQKARRVYARVAEIERPAQALAYLRKVDPYTFEELVLEAFAQRGYRIKRNARYSGDGGIDGRVWLDGELFLIQAKRYGGHISAAHVEDFGRVVEARGCKGFFIHTGRTGEGAARAAREADVWIISGQRLLALFDPAQTVGGKEA